MRTLAKHNALNQPACQVKFMSRTGAVRTAEDSPARFFTSGRKVLRIGAR